MKRLSEGETINNSGQTKQDEDGVNVQLKGIHVRRGIRASEYRQPITSFAVKGDRKLLVGKRGVKRVFLYFLKII